MTLPTHKFKVDEGVLKITFSFKTIIMTLHDNVTGKVVGSFVKTPDEVAEMIKEDN